MAKKIIVKTNDLLTTRQTAALLDMSAQYLASARWAKKGLPHIKHQRSVFYRPCDVVAVIARKQRLASVR